ncbi:MAG: LytTR family transcriptional regulator DNA-binding domain-containing protein [Lachnospiraceae bacterium]|nr:LytTR family transcriptional regulator DNA-binding domain-containing protein [Lachnospiraceae bacterium]
MDTDKAESDLIRETVSATTVRTGKDDVSYLLCESEKELDDILKVQELLDLSAVDIVNNDIQCAVTLRSKFESAKILLIADASISPMKYLRPDILASSLLLRPFKEKDLDTVIQDFLGSYYEEVEKDSESLFTVESRSGVLNIPYDKIIYFEANSKKLYARLVDEEYACYMTLDELSQQAPDYFERCHRSFIFNTRKVREYISAENILVMENGIEIPISRSYQAAIRKKMRK